jgi:hypothetical protein
MTGIRMTKGDSAGLLVVGGQPKWELNPIPFDLPSEILPTTHNQLVCYTHAHDLISLCMTTQKKNMNKRSQLARGSSLFVRFVLCFRVSKCLSWTWNFVTYILESFNVYVVPVIRTSQDYTFESQENESVDVFCGPLCGQCSQRCSPRYVCSCTQITLFIWSSLFFHLVCDKNSV